MKPFFIIISLILITFSCVNENSDNLNNPVELIPSEFDPDSRYELYRSTEESFQTDFFLKIEGENVTVYGWADTPLNDTVYYRVITEVNQMDSIKMRIKLENHELSAIKTTENNIDQFQEDTTLDYGSYILFHSSFFGKKTSAKIIQMQAVKHIYFGRADTFIFERIR
jgi:hypothetical protein